MEFNFQPIAWLYLCSFAWVGGQEALDVGQMSRVQNPQLVYFCDQNDSIHLKVLQSKSISGMFKSFRYLTMISERY